MAELELENVFRFVYSSSLDERIHIKIGTLDGQIPKPSYDKMLAEPLLCFSGVCSEELPSLKVILQVYSNGKPLGLPVHTNYKAFNKRFNFNEWVTLPVQYSELSLNSMLALTVVDCAGGGGREVILGGSTISFFGKNSVFRRGMYDLRVWPNVPADGGNPTQTPGKVRATNSVENRLAKWSRRHRASLMPRVDWMDRMTFREIEIIHEEEKKSSQYMYLLVEFQTVKCEEKEYSIVYYEPAGDLLYKFIPKPVIVAMRDEDILQDNLVEKKHHRLFRSARSDALDRELKPNAVDRDNLHKLVHVNPPNYMPTSEEQDLIWRFRFYLSSDKRALVVFLRCINWETPSEARQALNLVQMWSPLEAADALALLTPDFQQPKLREYAVRRLQESGDEALQMYLLQLVQALKYENLDEFEAFAESTLLPDTEDCIQSIDEHFDTLSQDAEFVSMMSHSGSSTAADQQQQQPHDDDPVLCSSKAGPIDLAADLADDPPNRTGLSDSLDADTEPEEPEQPLTLYSFLIERAGRNAHLANFLYWYLCVEIDCNEVSTRKSVVRVHHMYKTMLKLLKQSLRTGNERQRKIKHMLDRQQLFVDELLRLKKLSTHHDRVREQERFRELLADPDRFRFRFTSFEPLAFPLDPSVIITGIRPNETILFKSSMSPARLTFTTTTGVDYIAIFKFGDDLRQDQLVMQIIQMMDRMMRLENLDLKLTPYRVLSTGINHGFLQFVKSLPLCSLNKVGIGNHLMELNQVEDASAEAQKARLEETLDNYTRSLAGYCVITYLLGVGDRHLDNVLMTEHGAIFHIDFGFILGRDPKPMAPPMKLTGDMVDAMGGITSEHFRNFAKHVFTAFLYLRRHANLTLNLFALMVDASIPDIALEPDKAVQKVEHNLMLNLTEEQAILHLHNVIDASVSAVVPGMLDQMHKIAQYLRR